MIIFFLRRKYYSSIYAYAFDVPIKDIQVEYVTADEANNRGWWSHDFMVEI
jgi:hypothetical protein